MILIDSREDSILSGAVIKLCEEQKVEYKKQWLEIGDYITSSDTLGHGMKQSDDIMHNYTVAKATQAVDWSQESESTKLICCTYHAA